MSDIKEDLDKLFEKHGIKKAIVLLENDNETNRVLALSTDPKTGECAFAHLFQDCVQVSKGFRDILEHVSQHSMQDLIEKAISEGAITEITDDPLHVKKRVVH